MEMIKIEMIKMKNLDTKLEKILESLDELVNISKDERKITTEMKEKWNEFFKSVKKLDPLFNTLTFYLNL